MPITVKLDRDREIRWTARAQARNASLARPASFRELTNGKRRLYVLAAILWAALVDRDHDFGEPEDLAEYLNTGEQQGAAITAVGAMVAEAYPPQKKTGDGEKS